MFEVYLGLGSNVGERLRYLSSALQLLKQVVNPVAVSSVYETEPVGMSQAGAFFNIVVKGETALLPTELLKSIKAIETTLGRQPDTHNKPREIDIDIEIYNAYIYRDANVEVPHPAMHTRAFVLLPFAEIAPGLLHPALKKTIQQLCAECADSHSVIRTDYSLTA